MENEGNARIVATAESPSVPNVDTGDNVIIIKNKKDDEYTVCEMCGFFNKKHSAICKMCSNYLI